MKKLNNSKILDMITKFFIIFCIALSSIILLIHVVAVPYALWQGDEYDYFYNFRTQGSTFFWHRLLFWSPRPLSEAAIALYGLAVLYWGHPLIGWALGTVWIGCALLAFGPVLSDRTAWTSRIFLVAFAVMLIFLGHPVADLHYWPMAAAAHLPVVAAATCLTLTLITGRSHLSLEVLCLSIAALSSEAGLFLAISYLIFQSIKLALQKKRPHKLIWLLIPATICVVIVWRLIAGRAGIPHTHSSPTPDYAIASLRGSIRPFIYNLLMLQPNEVSAGGTTGGSVRDGIILKILIAFGGATLCRATGWRPPLSSILVLAFTFMATSFLTIAAANYEFGFLCCQRHETLRLDLSELVALLAGTGMARWLSLDSRSAMLCACASMTLFTAETMRWRQADMRLFLSSRAIENKAREATWASGKSAGPIMMMSQGTNSPLFYYWPWEAGIYKVGGPGWDVQSMMKFFGKQELIVHPPVAVSIPTRIH